MISVKINGTDTQYIKWLSAPHPIAPAIQTHIQIPGGDSLGLTLARGTDNPAVVLKGIVWYSAAGAAELDSITNARLTVDNGIESYEGLAAEPSLTGASSESWMEFTVTVTVQGV